MSAVRTYLDYNATAPLRAEAREAMLAAMDAGGNPSSVHAEGRRARAIVEKAREQVAALVGAEPRDVVFTSGATETANQVLRRAWGTVLFSRIEHPCVVAPALQSEGRIEDLHVGADGRIDPVALAVKLEAMSAAGHLPQGRSLLAVQMANNETGVLQPLGEIAAVAREHGVAMLCDAVQAAGRLAIDFATSGVDYMMISSHKIGGPKGVGALIAKGGGDIPPLVIGGGQENRRRAGTENVEGIAGFGAAAEAALRDLASMERIGAWRDRIEQEARAVRPDTAVVGSTAPRLANTSSLAVPGLASETLVIRLDLAGYAVSAGSACASGKVGSSPVLAAMGVAPDIARAAVRISLGHATTADDIDRFIETWCGIVSVSRNSSVTLPRASAPAAQHHEAAIAAAAMGER